MYGPVKGASNYSPNFSWCVRRIEWILILRMNINARNILTMQLSSLSVTIDLRHWTTLVHVSTLHTYKAASSLRNWTHCFSWLVRWLVQMVGRERVLADQGREIVGGPGGSLGGGEGVKSLWLECTAAQACTRTHTRARVSSHSWVCEDCVEFCGSVAGVYDAAVEA